MPRIRSLKYEYFINEDLAQTSCEARLLGLGLTTLADREGRLEDRPLRIKASLFPYHAVDVDALISELEGAGFLKRYTVNNQRFICIVNFRKHQKPHPKEAESVIPSHEKVKPSHEKVRLSREKETPSQEKEVTSRVVNGLGDLCSMGNGTSGNGERSSAEAAGASAANGFTIWSLAVGKLMTVGMAEQDARSFIGAQCKTYSKDKVSEAITKMLAQEPADPKAYLVAILKNSKSHPRGPSKVENSMNAVRQVLAEKEAQRDAVRN